VHEGQKRMADNEHHGARVFEQIAIVVRLEQRVDRNCYGARFHRAEKRVRECRTIDEQQHDALFATNPKLPQRAAEAVDLFGDL
jgi:hypothetical protein